MGQLKIREETNTPATPSEGVILYPTVATPSLLKIVDDAGNNYTLPFLEKANIFTTTQTITPAAAANVALIINTPTNASNEMLRIASADTGAGSYGPFMAIGRNSNATARAGWLRITGAGGNQNDIWPDNSATPGVLRIGNGTTSSTDLGGSIVGAQTSSLDMKDVIEEFKDVDKALAVILDTPLFRFHYKDDRLGKPEFLGIITDYSPIFGADPDEAHPNGRILNEVNAHGYAMAAIKALAGRLTKIEQKLGIA